MVHKNLPHSFRGLALSEKIREKMDASGVSPVEFAAMIGLSQSYTNSLMGGSRPWDGTDRETKKNIAHFLGLPLINVLMLAGIVESDDFMYEESIQDNLDNAYNSIRSDKVWGSFCQTRNEWAGLPLSTKVLIVLLYEKVSEIELIKKARMIQVMEPKKPAKKPRS